MNSVGRKLQKRNVLSINDERRFKSEPGSWARVERQGNGIELALRIDRQILSLGHEHHLLRAGKGRG